MCLYNLCSFSCFDFYFEICNLLFQTFEFANSILSEVLSRIFVSQLYSLKLSACILTIIIFVSIDHVTFIVSYGFVCKTASLCKVCFDKYCYCLVLVLFCLVSQPFIFNVFVSAAEVSYIQYIVGSCSKSIALCLCNVVYACVHFICL